MQFDHHYLWLQICRLAYLLKFICNPQINTPDNIMIIHGHAQNDKNLSHQMHLSPTKVEQSKDLPSFFSSRTVNRCCFQICLVPLFCILGYFFLLTSPFKMAPMHSAKVQCSVPKHKKAVPYVENKK